MTERTVIQLLMPGLLGPWPEASGPDFPLPHTPSLQRLLAVADRGLSGGDLYGLSCQLFGVRFDPEGGVPSAPLSRIGDGLAADDQYWLRADPIHLVADLRSLRWIQSEALDLEPEEAAALARTAGEVLGVAGASLEPATPQRWYLRLARDPGLRTCHGGNAVAADAESLLPSGPAARVWRRLLTEVQMVLASDPVNAKREQRGALPVNALWIWGGGQMPLSPAHSPVSAVCAVDPVLRGLARLCGASEWAEFGTAVKSAGRLLVHDAAATVPARERALETWIMALEDLEQRYFDPALAGLRAGTIDRVELYPLQGASYYIKRRALHRFWRTSRSLVSYL